MPIFEYKCNDCQTIFEQITTSSTTQEVNCSHCNSTNVKKILSASSHRSSQGTSLPMANSSSCPAGSKFS